MIFDVLNPRATATLALQGLTICCHNDSLSRWEIAIPHFLGHVILIRIPGMGTLRVGSDVRTIEIRARVGVATNPKYIVDGFNRTQRRGDLKDYRWLTDFNSEIPHGTVSMIKKRDDPHRPDVTMLYVYQAIGYTKYVEEHPMVIATQRETCPVVNGNPVPLPNDQAGLVLDAIRDIWGYSADTLGLDIEGAAGGEAVEIIFGNGIQTTIPKISVPQEILISNLEPEDADSPPGATVKTINHNHGRGDFYHYYQLLRVTGEHFHQWARLPPERSDVGPSEARTGDCNGVAVNFANLNDLLL